MFVTIISNGLDFRHRLFVGMVFADFCGYAHVYHQNVILLICSMVFKELAFMQSIYKLQKYVPLLFTFGARYFGICKRIWLF